EKGRAQARAVGEAFRQHGVPVDRILSSPYCRRLETARLMAVGPVESVLVVAARRAKADDRRLARPRHARAGDACADGAGAGWDPAGAGRDGGSQAQAWRSAGD